MIGFLTHKIGGCLRQHGHFGACQWDAGLLQGGFDRIEILRRGNHFKYIRLFADIIGAGFQRQLLSDNLTRGSYEALDLTAPQRRVSDAALLARQLGENLIAPGDVPDESTGCTATARRD